MPAAGAPRPSRSRTLSSARTTAVRCGRWGPDIPSYLFLGGLAGASSGLAAGAHPTGNRDASQQRGPRPKAISLSMAALVHDLGRPTRFVNMLRVLKVTSPMSVGTWILSAYTPLALTAAGFSLIRKLPLVDAAATIGRPRSVQPSPPTPGCCSATRPRPRGTTRTTNCRTCSSDRRRPQQADSACWPSARTRPGRRCGLR